MRFPHRSVLFIMDFFTYGMLKTEYTLRELINVELIFADERVKEFIFADSMS